MASRQCENCADDKTCEACGGRFKVTKDPSGVYCGNCFAGISTGVSRVRVSPEKCSVHGQEFCSICYENQTQKEILAIGVGRAAES